MILSVTLNPSLDQTLFLASLLLCDTNRVVRLEMDAGGKGLNLSRVAAELGATTVATGFLGGCPVIFIEDVLARQGVEADFVKIAGETRTNFSIEAMNWDAPTTLNASGPMIQISEWEELLDHVGRLVSSADWLCLCGSLPPGVPPDAYAILTRIGKESGTRVLVDADGEAMVNALAAQPNLVKPNSHEAERLLGRPVSTDEDALEAVRELYDLMGGGSAIALISLGEEGAVMCASEGVFRGYSPPVEAVSTVGSGDSMLGAILASLEREDDLETALRWGLSAGAATATTSGSEIGRRKVIEFLFDDARVVRMD